MVASITAAASAADYRHDIEVIDRALDGAKPDDSWVSFGDVGIQGGVAKRSYRVVVEP
jgi:hypothetical protein